ncbi:MAG: PIN domain-containing protein, partial [Chamaesiphon sp.]|nr:PIN domain-containing protein [Chamaesiphon sp.]
PSTAQEWFETSLTNVGIELFPITELVTVRAVELSPIHKDPFDRLIIATALVYEAKLASVDSVFFRYPELDLYLMK